MREKKLAIEITAFIALLFIVYVLAELLS